VALLRSGTVVDAATPREIKAEFAHEVNRGTFEMEREKERPLFDVRATRLVLLAAVTIAGVAYWRAHRPPVMPKPGEPSYQGRGEATLTENYNTMLREAMGVNDQDLLRCLSRFATPTKVRLQVGEAQPAGPILLKELGPRAVFSSGTAVIVVPGDLRSIDWDATEMQAARLNNGVDARVEITSSVLQELKRRRQELLALGVVPPPSPINKGLAATLRGIQEDRDYGEAFLCTDTPLYKFSLSTAPPGGPSWMNKQPALIARAGTRVYKEAVFGNSGIIRNETRIKLVQSLSAPSYFVMSNWLKDACGP
jgi:hypothetical protein